MTMRMHDGFGALTEKEKQTLRLIVRGHDAKSTARSLGLSVHTINERLREARRKMAVSSSREAARILLELEGGALDPPRPELSGDAKIGEDDAVTAVDQGPAPIDGVRRGHRRPWIFVGVFAMTFMLGLLALAAVPQMPTAPATPPVATTDAAPNAEVVEAARQFLALVDESRWEESYRSTGAAFQKLNTPKVWATVSEQVRASLGAMISRTFVSQENLPAPPSGYEVVKFRTRFANKAEALETVSLDKEGGRWRVVGVTVG